MKALALVPVLVVSLVAGCSSPAFYWYHPDRALDEAKADYTQCQGQAHEKAADMIGDRHYDPLPPPNGPLTSPRLRQQAQQDRTPRETRDAWRQQYEESVIADCMREKGYMMLRPNRVPHGVHTRKISRGGVAGR